MGWHEMGTDAYQAAGELRSHPRSCISRAYYAAYSLISSELSATKGVSFPLGRHGPSHTDLPNLIGAHLRRKFGHKHVKDLKAAIRRLYFARLEADYEPHQKLGEDEARKAVLDARLVLEKFGALSGGPI